MPVELTSQWHLAVQGRIVSAAEGGWSVSSMKLQVAVGSRVCRVVLSSASSIAVLLKIEIDDGESGSRVAIRVADDLMLT